MTHNDWKQARAGRFTSSIIGKLMSAPRSISDADIEKYRHLVTDMEPWTETKSGVNKGQLRKTPGYNDRLKAAMEDNGVVLFGDTALSVIRKKAHERLSGRPEPEFYTFATQRGNDLEEVARELVSTHWQKIYVTGAERNQFVPWGDWGGCTIDGLADEGEATLDIKCPQDTGKIIGYATSVSDGDNEALKAWDSDYYWQIQDQMRVMGLKRGYLVYFDDRWALYKHDVSKYLDLDFVQFAPEDQGFAYIVRSFPADPEAHRLIELTINAAAILCGEMVEALTNEAILNQQRRNA